MQRCGLCSLLAGLLRRAMCLGSRRGSAESYYQELADTPAGQDQPGTADDAVADVTTAETPDSACLRMANNVSPAGSPPRSVSPTDRRLLRSLVTASGDAVGDRGDVITATAVTAGDEDVVTAADRRRGACFARGRFLTMHKRRRKRLATRSLLQDTAILDDMLHGQAQRILDQASNWRFNAFTLEVVTGGRSLPILCVHLFHWYGLLSHFNLDPVRVWKMFSLIEEGYHSTNPYHNSVHAADVTQAMHCFLLQDQIRENLQPLEIMAALIGAVAHDLDHPGVNQPFLIATSNHLAALYENTSVLENHHWRSAIGCLLESGVAQQLEQRLRPELEQQISSLILATDITRQQEFIGRFKEYLDTGSLDMRKAADRHFILQISLKCADISNPCRPWDVSKKWSQKVCEEFFRQGDYERQLGLPVTTLCDRHSTSMSKIQAGFFRFVVTPLFDEWHRFLDTALSREMMRNLRGNQRRWEALIAQETAEETRTEISETEVIDADAELEDVGGTPHRQQRLSLRSESAHAHDPEGEGEREEEEEHDGRGSEENLLPELPTLKLSPTIRVQADGRRYSVPISIVTQPPPHLGHGLGAGGKRRESMPAEHIVPRSVADWDSSLSLLTSTSSAESHVGGLSAAGNSGPSERPLSAENLLPEPSIASMTSVNADRLSCVLGGGAGGGAGAGGGGTRHLIRQQTFPPLQPGAAGGGRARYMSTAADLSGGRTRYVLPEAPSSRSSSSSDSLKAPVVLPPVPQQSASGGGQRPSWTQKENVDPALKRGSLSKRRGSAPAPMQCGAGGEGALTAAGGIVRSVHRRGSVPAAIIKLRSFEVDPHLYVDPEWSTPSNRSAPTSGAGSECGAPPPTMTSLAAPQTSASKRRSSVPCEAPAKVRADLSPLEPLATSLNGRTTSLTTTSSGVAAPLRANGNKNNGAQTTPTPQQQQHRRRLSLSAATAGVQGELLTPNNGGAEGRRGVARGRGQQPGTGGGDGNSQQQQRRRGSLPADAVSLTYTGSIRR